MELQCRLVAGADIWTPCGILKMHRQQALRAANREVLNRSERKAVKPRLKRESFRLLGSVGSIAQSAGDGFVDDFFLSDGVGRNFLGGFPKIEFALDEALQAAET